MHELNRDQIFFKMCIEKKTPLIPEYVNRKFVQIIKDGWHQERTKRPSFTEIHSRLRDIKDVFFNTKEKFLTIWDFLIIILNNNTLLTPLAIPDNNT